MSLEIHPKYFNSAGSWGEQPSEHLDSRGLAGAVGSEEAKKLARSDAQVDAINGQEFSEAAAQGLSADSWSWVHRKSESSIMRTRDLRPQAPVFFNFARD